MVAAQPDVGDDAVRGREGRDRTAENSRRVAAWGVPCFRRNRMDCRAVVVWCKRSEISCSSIRLVDGIGIRVACATSEVRDVIHAISQSDLIRVGAHCRRDDDQSSSM
ncbi:hypothetical protein FGB62_289g07 [Gracilaria domingensis]|nr:hypothetical protein FGB62_289g07 [Gracilaria domingensis]